MDWTITRQNVPQYEHLQLRLTQTVSTLAESETEEFGGAGSLPIADMFEG